MEQILGVSYESFSLQREKSEQEHFSQYLIQDTAGALWGPECLLSEGRWPTVAADVGTEPKVEGALVEGFTPQGRVLVTTV